MLNVQQIVIWKSMLIQFTEPYIYHEFNTAYMATEHAMAQLGNCKAWNHWEIYYVIQLSLNWNKMFQLQSFPFI